MSLTPRQIANKANAQKSTGPKSTEGKAKSSMNAMKHGLAARHIVLQNESPEDFEELRRGWIDSLNPVDMAELTLVECAVAADWRLKRCLRAERARLTIRYAHSVEIRRFEQFKRAEELGAKLIHDPISRVKVPDLDPETTRKLNAWREINPAIIAREMETFSEGVAWLLHRWERLHHTLKTEHFWHYPEKLEAIRLLGLRPDDALNDQLVGAIVLCCIKLHPAPWSVIDEVQQGALGVDGRPVYLIRANILAERMPETRQDAAGSLLAIIDEETKRLKELKEGLDNLASLDRQQLQQVSMFDDSKEGVLALRYEWAQSRELHRAVNVLIKKRKDESILEKRAEKTFEPEPEVVAEEEVPVPANTHRTAPPNEPNRPDEMTSPKPSENRKARRARERMSKMKPN